MVRDTAYRDQGKEYLLHLASTFCMTSIYVVPNQTVFSNPLIPAYYLNQCFEDDQLELEERERFII